MVKAMVKTMEKKTFQAPMEFKTGQKGQFSAVFATLGVVDADNDVTRAGAFGRQRVLIEAWNHDLARPPVGQGAIREVGNEAIVEGKFFLDTPSGAEHYAIARALGPDQEFSYTFRILKSEPGTYGGKQVRVLTGLDVIGVSQVTRAAGVGTRLTDIKSGPGRRDFLPMGPQTPAAIDRRIAALSKELGLDQTPAAIDRQIANLATALGFSDSGPAPSARTGSTKPTNRERIRAAIEAEYGPGHSARWIDAMVDGELQSMAEIHYRAQEALAGGGPNMARAQEAVARWASRPVR